jgi:hypothetical protein
MKGMTSTSLLAYKRKWLHLVSCAVARQRLHMQVSNSAAMLYLLVTRCVRDRSITFPAAYRTDGALPLMRQGWSGRTGMAWQPGALGRACLALLLRGYRKWLMVHLLCGWL